MKNNLNIENEWTIYEEKFNSEQIVTTGSNFMIGNGYLGYRGTFAEWEKDKYPACIVTDTYDMADGKWRELCNAPNGLYTRLLVDGEKVTVDENTKDYRRAIDLQKGIYSRQFNWENKLKISVEKFASYANLHLVPMEYKIEALDDIKISLITGIDGDVWSLNGEHFQEYKLLEGEEGGPKCLAIETTTTEKGIQLVVFEGHTFEGKKPVEEEIIKEGRKILRKYVLELEKGNKITLKKMAVIYSSNDVNDPRKKAKKDLQLALSTDYKELKQEHVRDWEQFWEKSDIKIEGDLEAQIALRFNLYHNRIATPAHSDRLPIGARGLSCQAYQGAAFWDQEIFNLPMFLYTESDIARNILKYRFHTLDGARDKARKLGYKGAFYAWISGKTGQELCPSYFFKNVLTGRRIHNHFNDWQIHISPDIAYTIWHYYRATGDWNFVVEYGAEMIFEIARFLYSHAYYKKDKERYEFIRLLGPDEYHENVDNNAFTNYQAKFTLDKALYIYHRLAEEDEERLNELKEKIGLEDKEVSGWQDMALHIYLPQPDEKTLLIEQFDGYFDLEDITPSELAKRLQDPGEYWGWPNGIAVETQVIKQADVIQLFCLHDEFDKEVMKANYDYYEPRTQHGSSLSPSAYSIVANKVGYIEEAYKNFMKSCTIDLYNTNKAVSGGTFIGGIHTAACGAAWQMMVNGFAGMELLDDGLRFNPALPEKWNKVSFALTYRHQNIMVSFTDQEFSVRADKNNTGTLKIKVGEETIIGPGEEKVFKLG